MKGGSCFSFSGEETASLKAVPPGPHSLAVSVARPFLPSNPLTPVVGPAAEPLLGSIESLVVSRNPALCGDYTVLSKSLVPEVVEETQCATLNEAVTLMTGDTVWPSCSSSRSQA